MKPITGSAIVEELIETGNISSFKVIDMHGHMGHFVSIYFPSHEPAEMIRTMDRCGIEYLVFSHHDALQNMVTGNLKAQAAIDSYPDRFIGYCAVNPRYPEQLKGLVDTFDQRRGFAGYKILAGYYQAPITLPACVPLWEHAQDERLPVLLHTWGGDQCAGPEQIRTIAGTYPDVPILMAHSQFADWESAVALTKEFPNVYCDLCAAYAAGAVQHMVDAGIEDRVLFGTDLPWFDPMHGIGCVVFSRISDTARRRILRDNAEELFQRWRP